MPYAGVQGTKLPYAGVQGTELPYACVQGTELWYACVQGDERRLQLHAVELEPQHGSYGLMIGRDGHERLVVQHTERGRPILKGDR